MSVYLSYLLYAYPTKDISDLIKKYEKLKELSDLVKYNYNEFMKYFAKPIYRKYQPKLFEKFYNNALMYANPIMRYYKQIEEISEKIMFQIMNIKMRGKRRQKIMYSIENVLKSAGEILNKANENINEMMIALEVKK